MCAGTWVSWLLEMVSVALAEVFVVAGFFMWLDGTLSFWAFWTVLLFGVLFAGALVNVIALQTPQRIFTRLYMNLIAVVVHMGWTMLSGAALWVMISGDLNSESGKTWVSQVLFLIFAVLFVHHSFELVLRVMLSRILVRVRMRR